MTEPDPHREAVEARLRELLGPGAVPGEVPAADTDAPVAAPADPDQTAALLRVASEEGWRVRPTGTGLGLDLLPGGGGRVGPASRPDILVSSARLGGIRGYEPADLTVRAGAGTTLGELEEVLAAEGQWLPLDPPGGPAVTLGGVFAMATAGPLAAGFGRPRDQLLGLTMVDGGGRRLELGGRVVKNVAGFDLVRLATGSRGALGFIHEVSLRLFPRPPADVTLEWRLAGRREGLELGRGLARLPLPVAALELLDGGGGGPRGGPADGPRVLLRLAGNPGAVRSSEAKARALAGEPERRLEGGASAGAARERAVEEGAGCPFLRLQALPDRAEALVGALEESFPPSTPGGARLAVHLTSGTVRVWGGEAPLAVLEGLDRLTRTTAAAGGTVRVLRLGAQEGRRAEGHRLGPGLDAGIGRLHRKLREAFDPGGVLPGAWREGWA